MAKYQLRAPHFIGEGLRETGTEIGDGTQIPYTADPTPYMLGLDDEGKAKVEAIMEKNFGGAEPLPGFVQMAPIEGMPLVNTAVPALMGTGTPGSILECTMGIWEGEPTTYVYEWRRDGVAIGPAGGLANYTVLDTDVGHDITCVVGASNPIGTAVAPPSNAVTITAAGTQAASASRSPAPKSPPAHHSSKKEE